MTSLDSGQGFHRWIWSLLIAFWLSSLLLASVQAAPLESWEKELDFPQDVRHRRDASNRCYYQYQYYNEGDQIKTNEPCLNCTCKNQMLMCYLNVCPFIKPVGKNCVVEKHEDQCCPTIMCPQVPVELWTSTTLPPPMLSDQSAISSTSTDGFSVISASTNISALPMTSIPGQGCNIDDQFYMDGMQIPRDPNNPCELCYCIRNHTACVMQECRLKVPGCEPIFQEGVCCPVKYMCKDGIYFPGQGGLIGLDGETQTTAVPAKNGCYQNGNYIEEGTNIETKDPCEHCYCMGGDIICAIDPCMGGPLEGETDNCIALPPPEGECCTKEYVCTPNNITDILDSVASTTDDIGQTTGDEIILPEGTEGEEKEPTDEIQDDGDDDLPLAGFEDNGTEPQQGQGSSTLVQDSNEADVTESSEEAQSSAQVKPLDSSTMISTEEAEGNENLPLTTTEAGKDKNTCSLNGTTYEDGADVPSQNPCDGLCQCYKGAIICASVDCLPPPKNHVDCKPIFKEGQCCPSYDCLEILEQVDPDEILDDDYYSEEEEAISTSSPIGSTTSQEGIASSEEVQTTTQGLDEIVSTTAPTSTTIVTDGNQEISESSSDKNATTSVPSVTTQSSTMLTEGQEQTEGDSEQSSTDNDIPDTTTTSSDSVELEDQQNDSITQGSTALVEDNDSVNNEDNIETITTTSSSQVVVNEEEATTSQSQTSIDGEIQDDDAAEIDTELMKPEGTSSSENIGSTTLDSLSITGQELETTTATGTFTTTEDSEQTSIGSVQPTTAASASVDGNVLEDDADVGEETKPVKPEDSVGSESTTQASDMTTDGSETSTIEEVQFTSQASQDIPNGEVPAVTTSSTTVDDSETNFEASKPNEVGSEDSLGSINLEESTSTENVATSTLSSQSSTDQESDVTTIEDTISTTESNASIVEGTLDDDADNETPQPVGPQGTDSGEELDSTTVDSTLNSNQETTTMSDTLSTTSPQQTTAGGSQTTTAASVLDAGEILDDDTDYDTASEDLKPVEPSPSESFESTTVDSLTTDDQDSESTTMADVASTTESLIQTTMGDIPSTTGASGLVDTSDATEEGSVKPSEISSSEGLESTTVDSTVANDQKSEATTIIGDTDLSTSSLDQTTIDVIQSTTAPSASIDGDILDEDTNEEIVKPAPGSGVTEGSPLSTEQESETTTMGDIVSTTNGLVQSTTAPSASIDGEILDDNTDVENVKPVPGSGSTEESLLSTEQESETTTTGDIGSTTNGLDQSTTSSSASIDGEILDDDTDEEIVKPAPEAGSTDDSVLGNEQDAEATTMDNMVSTMNGLDQSTMEAIQSTTAPSSSIDGEILDDNTEAEIVKPTPGAVSTEDSLLIAEQESEATTTDDMASTTNGLDESTMNAIQSTTAPSALIDGEILEDNTDAEIVKPVPGSGSTEESLLSEEQESETTTNGVIASTTNGLDQSTTVPSASIDGEILDDDTDEEIVKPAPGSISTEESLLSTEQESETTTMGDIVSTTNGLVQSTTAPSASIDGEILDDNTDAENVKPVPGSGSTEESLLSTEQESETTTTGDIGSTTDGLEQTPMVGIQSTTEPSSSQELGSTTTGAISSSDEESETTTVGDNDSTTEGLEQTSIGPMDIINAEAMIDEIGNNSIAESLNTTGLDTVSEETTIDISLQTTNQEVETTTVSDTLSTTENLLQVSTGVSQSTTAASAPIDGEILDDDTDDDTGFQSELSTESSTTEKGTGLDSDLNADEEKDITTTESSQASSTEEIESSTGAASSSSDEETDQAMKTERPEFTTIGQSTTSSLTSSIPGEISEGQEEELSTSTTSIDETTSQGTTSSPKEPAIQVSSELEDLPSDFDILDDDYDNNDSSILSTTLDSISSSVPSNFPTGELETTMGSIDSTTSIPVSTIKDMGVSLNESNDLVSTTISSDLSTTPLLESDDNATTGAPNMTTTSLGLEIVDSSTSDSTIVPSDSSTEIDLTASSTIVSTISSIGADSTDSGDSMASTNDSNSETSEGQESTTLSAMEVTTAFEDTSDSNATGIVFPSSTSTLPISGQAETEADEIQDNEAADQDAIVFPDSVNSTTITSTTPGSIDATTAEQQELQQQTSTESAVTIDSDTSLSCLLFNNCKNVTNSEPEALASTVNETDSINGTDISTGGEGSGLLCLLFNNCNGTLKPTDGSDKLDSTVVTSDYSDILDDDSEYDPDEILDDEDGEAIDYNQDECVVKNETYGNFADVPSENPCELCYCNYGHVICSTQICEPPQGFEDCTPLETKANECCPRQYDCAAPSLETSTVTVTVGPSGEVESTTTASGIPGEGNCLQNGISFTNGSTVPLSNKCHAYCLCVDSEIKCDRIPCHPAPDVPGLKCEEFFIEGECCPSHNCVSAEPPVIEAGSSISTSESEQQSNMTSNEDETVSTTEGIMTTTFSSVDTSSVGSDTQVSQDENVTENVDQQTSTDVSSTEEAVSEESEATTTPPLDGAETEEAVSEESEATTTLPLDGAETEDETIGQGQSTTQSSSDQATNANDLTTVASSSTIASDIENDPEKPATAATNDQEAIVTESTLGQDQLTESSTGEPSTGTEVSMTDAPGTEAETDTDSSSTMSTLQGDIEETLTTESDGITESGTQSSVDKDEAQGTGGPADIDEESTTLTSGEVEEGSGTTASVVEIDQGLGTTSATEIDEESGTTVTGSVEDEPMTESSVDMELGSETMTPTDIDTESVTMSSVEGVTGTTVASGTVDDAITMTPMSDTEEGLGTMLPIEIEADLGETTSANADESVTDSSIDVETTATADIVGAGTVAPVPDEIGSGEGLVTTTSSTDLEEGSGTMASIVEMEEESVTTSASPELEEESIITSSSIDSEEELVTTLSSNDLEEELVTTSASTELGEESVTTSSSIDLEEGSVTTSSSIDLEDESGTMTSITDMKEGEVTTSQPIDVEGLATTSMENIVESVTMSSNESEDVNETIEGQETDVEATTLLPPGQGELPDSTSGTDSDELSMQLTGDQEGQEVEETDSESTEVVPTTTDVPETGSEQPSITTTQQSINQENLVTSTTVASGTIEYCLSNGMVIQNGKDVPTSNPCELCQCIDGDVICAIRECPVPEEFKNCRALPIPRDECCPQYTCDEILDDDAGGDYDFDLDNQNLNVTESTTTVGSISSDPNQSSNASTSRPTELNSTQASDTDNGGLIGLIEDILDAQAQVSSTQSPVDKIDVNETISTDTQASTGVDDPIIFPDTELSSISPLNEGTSSGISSTTVVSTINSTGQIIDSDTAVTEDAETLLSTTESATGTSDASSAQDGSLPNSTQDTIFTSSAPETNDPLLTSTTNGGLDTTTIIPSVNITSGTSSINSTSDTSGLVNSTTVPESVTGTTVDEIQTSTTTETSSFNMTQAISSEGPIEGVAVTETITEIPISTTVLSNESTMASVSEASEASSTATNNEIAPSKTTTTPATTTTSVIGTASSDVLGESDPQSSALAGTEQSTSDDEVSLDDYENYDQISLDQIGPGACLFDGKIYVSAQQIPRENPCDFCFCFRGDIICLQQSCPPPIPGCNQEPIDGFCCPRYECPVKMGLMNVTTTIPQEPPSFVQWLMGNGGADEGEEEEVTEQVRGCEIQGNFYERGAIVESASGPCLQCRCGYNEKLECEPQPCEPAPLMKRMLTLR